MLDWSEYGTGHDVELVLNVECSNLTGLSVGLVLMLDQS